MKVGIIGGSGLYHLEELEGVEEVADGLTKVPVGIHCLIVFNLSVQEERGTKGMQIIYWRLISS